MSRIGKQPIPVPSSVTIAINGNEITVKGPKGELKHTLTPLVTVKQVDAELIIERTEDSSQAAAFHGLNRSLLANMIHGVSEGFEKRLEIIGVGYRANLKGKILELSLGFSHPVKYAIPEGIEIKQDEENKNILIIRGIDKQKVGQSAADIRAYRKPEPYKGKGIRYVDEYVRRKAGKAAAAA